MASSTFHPAPSQTPAHILWDFTVDMNKQVSVVYRYYKHNKHKLEQRIKNINDV